MTPNPLSILLILLNTRHSIFYVDTNQDRLKEALKIGAHAVIDASKLSGMGHVHPEIALLVETPDWDINFKKEVLALPQNCVVKFWLPK